MRLHGQGHPSQILLSHRPYEAYNCTALCATPFPVLVFKSPPSFVLYHEAEIIAINQPFFKTFQYANLALASCPLHQCWHLYFYCCQQHAYTESLSMPILFKYLYTICRKTCIHLVERSEACLRVAVVHTQTFKQCMRQSIWRNELSTTL